jgi:Kef-type K+ transport system membrane component KefB
VCWALGLDTLPTIVAASTLTATSVGITARVLSDLNRLGDPESQIILGAAVIDDVIGLVILGVVGGLIQGQEVTVTGVTQTTLVAFGFLALALLAGKKIVVPFVRFAGRVGMFGTPTMLAIVLALGLAWLASVSGSAVIIGAFAAGVILHGTTHAHEIERGAAHLGQFFVPIFFVAVGAAVDLRVLNPADPANLNTLMIAGALFAVGVVGKFAAGYAPFWFRGNKKVIGVGMIPRGEVGLIFAQLGLGSGVLTSGIFAAVTLMVMMTTFIAPPVLKMLLGPAEAKRKPRQPEGIEELVTEP